jgi:hypothetical protein
METKTINLRDLPEDLVRKAKAYAALCGMSLKDFVVRAIEKAMQDDLPVSVSSARMFFGASTKKPRAGRKRSKRRNETVSE